MATNPRNTNGHRRRQIRQRVLAAYEVCALCGHHVDKTLRTPHPMSPEVDEIIPVSFGGDPLAWENVQLTHRQCNQRKGNGTHTAKTPSAATTPCPTSQDW